MAHNSNVDIYSNVTLNDQMREYKYGESQNVVHSTVVTIHEAVALSQSIPTIPSLSLHHKLASSPFPR